MRWSLFLLALALLSTACGRAEPAFVSVLVPMDTYDTVGPYRVEAHVLAPIGVGRLLLRVQSEPDSDLFSERLLRASDPEDETAAWGVELPGRPAGTEYAFYLLLADLDGALVRDPVDAPAELHRFTVLASPPAEP